MNERLDQIVRSRERLTPETLALIEGHLSHLEPTLSNLGARALARELDLAWRERDRAQDELRKAHDTLLLAGASPREVVLETPLWARIANWHNTLSEHKHELERLESLLDFIGAPRENEGRELSPHERFASWYSAHHSSIDRASIAEPGVTHLSCPSCGTPCLKVPSPHGHYPLTPRPPTIAQYVGSQEALSETMHELAELRESLEKERSDGP